MSPELSVRRQKVWMVAGGFVAAFAIGCGGTTSTDGTQVSTTVSGDGQGVGRVTSTDPDVDIDCLLGPNVPNPGRCADQFTDAGLGGMFSLVAQANPGSTFAGWSGCSEFIGNECFLSFDLGESNVTFNVTATFEPDTTNMQRGVRR